MNLRQIFAVVLAGLVKIAVAIWIINFIVTKTGDIYDFGYRIFTEEAISPAPGREITVAFTEGKSNMEIAQILYDKGLVRDKNLAFAQILCSEYREAIVPGVYTLTTAMTTEEMLAAMVPPEGDEE